MSSLLQATPEYVKDFLFRMVSGHPSFSAVIAISVDRYPGEFFATIWVGQEPAAEMREYTQTLEVQLRDLGVPCSIVVKTDRDLTLGGERDLPTIVGQFTYKFYRIDSDPAKDEDLVYVYAVYRGDETFRFRMSLSGQLASMLRRRNALDESDVEAKYLEWIKREIEAGGLVKGKLRPIRFDPSHLSRFVGSVQ